MPELLGFCKIHTTLCLFTLLQNQKSHCSPRHEGLVCEPRADETNPTLIVSLLSQYMAQNTHGHRMVLAREFILHTPLGKSIL